MAAPRIDVPAPDAFAVIAREEIERRAYARFLQRSIASCRANRWSR